MNWQELQESVQYLAQPTYLYLLGAAAVLFVLLVLLKRRQPKSVVAYSTENGRVMVARSAISELVQTSCEQISAVSKPKIKIKARGKVTHFEIRVKLMSGGSLRQIESTLQTHLRRNLTENLGIERLGRIDITATGFKSGKISDLTRTPQIPMDEPEFAESDDIASMDLGDDVDEKTEKK